MNALIYAPSGGGKTVCSTMVAAPNRGKNLLLCSDNSHIVLQNKEFARPNLDIEVVTHWLSVSPTGEPRRSFKQQFAEAVNSKLYDNIIIDNVSDIFDMAILEYDQVGKIKDPRQYYQAVYQDLKRLAREAGQVDCNVIFTAWTDLQTITSPTTGEQIIRTQPKLPNKILDNFAGLVNIVGYIHSQERNGARQWLYVLTGSESLYAKDQALNRKYCLPQDLFTAPAEN